MADYIYCGIDPPVGADGTQQLLIGPYNAIWCPPANLPVIPAAGDKVWLVCGASAGATPVLLGGGRYLGHECGGRGLDQPRVAGGQASGPRPGDRVSGAHQHGLPPSWRCGHPPGPPNREFGCDQSGVEPGVRASGPVALADCSRLHEMVRPHQGLSGRRNGEKYYLGPIDAQGRSRSTPSSRACSASYPRHLSGRGNSVSSFFREKWGQLIFSCI